MHQKDFKLAMASRRAAFGGNTSLIATINPFKPFGVKWLHFKVFRAILVWPIVFNSLTFGHSSARVPECQKIKKGWLDQYVAERFGRLIFATVQKV